MGQPVVELAGQAYFDHPFDILETARLRGPVVPVRASMMVRGTGHLVTRHAEVKALYADPRFSSDQMGRPGMRRIKPLLPPIVRLLGETLVMQDGSEHRRGRSALSSAFTSRFVLGLEPSILNAANDLIDRLQSRRGGDVVADYAAQLPLWVISDMLGIDEGVRADFHAVVGRMQQQPDSKMGLLRKIRLMREIASILEAIIAEKRLRPDDKLVTAIIEAGAGEKFSSHREVLATVFLLFLAGYETTSNLISGSVLALMDHPDQYSALAGDATLWPTAIEELLRYVTPVTTGSIRFATEDVLLGGCLIPKGAQALGLILSANFDDDVFPEASVLNIRRVENPHLSFGFGIHFCLGRHLARLEATIALRVLMERCQGLRLTIPRDAVSYRCDLTARALRTLPVEVGTAQDGWRAVRAM